jgi:hypothetical protein
VARFWTVLQHHNVSVENVPANHRITGHSQGKRVPRRLEPDAFNVHRNATFGILLARLGQTRRN